METRGLGFTQEHQEQTDEEFWDSSHSLTDRHGISDILEEASEGPKEVLMTAASVTQKQTRDRVNWRGVEMSTSPEGLKRDPDMDSGVTLKTEGPRTF